MGKWMSAFRQVLSKYIIIIADRLWQTECLGGSLPAAGELGFGEQGGELVVDSPQV
jgi:hypothetical protein